MRGHLTARTRLIFAYNNVKISAPLSVTATVCSQ